MFGYITVNKEELKLKEYKEYHAYYCGLCKALRIRYGHVAQLTLTYDMTFLVVLLTGLYEEESRDTLQRCTVHMGKKHRTLENRFSEYAADMNILLSYHNLMDDWLDEKKISRLTMAMGLKKAYDRVSLKYPRQCRAVAVYMEKLGECEAEKEAGTESLDKAAGYTGELLGEIFVYKEDQWADTLRSMGFFMGKFIYLMDAYEDIGQDREKNNYNPLIELSGREDFERRCHAMLTMMAAEAAKEFERLPILMNAEILRNILYSGIWAKYEIISRKRKEQVKEHDDRPL